MDADFGKIKHFNSASAVVVNIPGTLTSPAGNQIGFRQTGAGQVTYTATSGMTLNSPNGLKSRTQYSVASLIFESATVAYIDGDTEV